MADLSEITKRLVERDIAKIEELTRATINAIKTTNQVYRRFVWTGS